MHIRITVKAGERELYSDLDFTDEDMRLGPAEFKHRYLGSTIAAAYSLIFPYSYNEETGELDRVIKRDG